jgi:hypothetical protein
VANRLARSAAYRKAEEANEGELHALRVGRDVIMASSPRLDRLVVHPAA